MDVCYSFEAEARTLGCILLDEKVAFNLLETAGITSCHFYDLRHKELFRLMEKLFKAHQRVDMFAVMDRFAAGQNCADPAADRVYIATLPDAVASVWSLPLFIEELKEMQQRRLALDVARRLLQAAGDKGAPAGQLLEDAETAFAQMRKITAPKALTIRTAAELLEESLVDNDNLLGDRLLARGQSLTLLGAGGIGKSRLLLQLAACSITGRPFLGLRVHVPDLKWLIFQAENSKRRLQTDLQRLRAWLGDDWTRVASRLYIHTVEHADDCFVQLDQPGVRTRLGNVITQIDPDVVCFDPLNCFGVGDLNRDGDMRNTCQAITQLCAEGRADRAVVVLHHALTGKAGAARATGFDRSSFGRNSKLLQAWTRGQINLAPASGDDNARLVVSCGKCSNGEEFAPFAARLNPATMIYEAEPGFDHQAWQRQLSEGPARRPEDDLLDLCEQPQPRNEAARQLVARGHSQASAYRIIQRALEDNLVRLEGSILHRADLD